MCISFPPYFDHDAFMHHPMHVLDAPECRPIGLGLLLDHIPVSSVPRATVRTLKSKKPKKPKNLKTVLKNLRFLPAMAKYDVYSIGLRR